MLNLSTSNMNYLKILVSISCQIWAFTGTLFRWSVIQMKGRTLLKKLIASRYRKSQNRSSRLTVRVQVIFYLALGLDSAMELLFCGGGDPTLHKQFDISAISSIYFLDIVFRERQKIR